VTDTATYLREVREKQGLTRDDVVQATRIPRYYVEMMEGEGDTRLISDPLYLVHYVRRYADHLHIEQSEQLAAQFIRENTRLQGSKRTRPPQKRERSPSIVPWFLVLLVIVGAGAVYLYGPNLPTQFFKRDTGTAVDTTPASVDKAPANLPAEATQPVKAEPSGTSKNAVMVLQPEASEIVPPGDKLEQPGVTNTEPVASTVVDATVAEPAGTKPATEENAHPEGVASQPQSAATTPAEKVTKAPVEKAKEGQRLQIVAKEKAWVRVIVDGQRPQDVMMEPGDSKSWSAEKQFVLTFGNAGGVDMTFNGKKIPPLGASGQVVRNYKLPK
jgi:cytoskeleton protein RodZ